MRYALYALSLVSALSVSCIDDDCGCNAAFGTLSVTVADRNYDNVAEIAGQVRRDEGLPFASYLTGLTLWRHAEGTSIGESFRPDVRLEDADAMVDPVWLLSGTNHLVLAGNEPAPAQSAGGTLFTRELHPGADEADDLYVGSADVVAPLRRDHTIRMFRAKGKLLILTDGIPSDVVGVEVAAGNLYRNVGADLAYTDSAGVVKRFALTRAAGELSLLSAPGRAPDGASAVTLRLAKRDGATVTLSAIRTAIRRNRISVIRPVYDPEPGAWNMDVFVDGRWSRIEDLKIN